jgi:hypothetical protein
MGDGVTAKLTEPIFIPYIAGSLIGSFFLSFVNSGFRSPPSALSYEPFFEQLFAMQGALPTLNPPELVLHPTPRTSSAESFMVLNAGFS